MINKKDYILFGSKYPQNEALKEGMSQRIIAIDEKFSDSERIYLFVSHRFYKKKEVIYCKDKVTQINCNLFMHFSLILNLLRNSRFIYFHSVQNILPLYPVLFFLAKKKKIILDVHGSVPEEHLLAGRPFKSNLYGIVEKYIFKRLVLTITVTDAMARFYKSKYHKSKTQTITYPILPTHILSKNEFIEPQDSNTFINVVYSGNLQAWQNINLMLDTIANNLADNVKYYILTGDRQQMAERLKERGIGEKNNVFLDSVTPDELESFYAIAHYGFILRDDIVVNNVACPTKMIEYMHYGIVPIVKATKIGDFDELGFEYLKVEDFKSSTLKPQKSKKNSEIISSLKEKTSIFNTENFILSINRCLSTT